MAHIFHVTCCILTRCHMILSFNTYSNNNNNRGSNGWRTWASLAKIDENKLSSAFSHSKSKATAIVKFARLFFKQYFKLPYFLSSLDVVTFWLSKCDDNLARDIKFRVMRGLDEPVRKDGIGYFNGVILHRMCNFKIEMCNIKIGNV